MSDYHHILDSKKRQIDTSLARLYDEVSSAIDSAIHCLSTQDRMVCQNLIEHDVVLNDLRRLIEQDCLVAIASQQPVAHDLRDIVADMQIAGELERMGDYASDIATSVIEMDASDLTPLALSDVQTMARMFQEMLSDAIRAHHDDDAERALGAKAADDRLDAQLEKVVAAILDAVQKDTALVNNGMHMLWIAHNLERGGDRVTNIAEQVVFRVTGQRVHLD